MSWKALIGRQLKAARCRSGLSRTALGARVGVSPKTIQSWEIGRTFIENLSILPALERELSVNVGALLNQLIGSRRRNEPEEQGIHARPVVVEVVDATEQASITRTWVAVPVVEPKGKDLPPAPEMRLRVREHIPVPLLWSGLRRHRNLMAFCMRDRQMEPFVPHMATVVVDGSLPTVDDYEDGSVVAAYLAGRGIRIRFLRRSAEGRLTLVPVSGNVGRFRVSPPADRIFGRLLGITADCGSLIRHRAWQQYTIEPPRGAPAAGASRKETQALRRRTIARMALAGMTPPQIAQALGVSRQAVHYQIEGILSAIETGV